MEMEIFLQATQPGVAGVRELEVKCEEILDGWGLQAPSFMFALREALLNALEANGLWQEGDRFIEVTIMRSGDELTAIVPDWGPGFPEDWKTERLNVDMADILNEDRGRGLLFMREMCDELESGKDGQGRHIMILKVRLL